MSPVKNAVIAVAGMGKSLGLGKAKCLVEVGGRTILEYQLNLLKDVENVFLVVGFREKDVIDAAVKIRKDIIFVRNANFQHTKTLGSFYLAAKNIHDDAIFMDGDMIIEPQSFKNFIAAAETSESVIAVTERISDDPVYANAVEDKTGALFVNGFSYKKKSPYEWANIVYISAQSMADGVTHTFEYLQKFLPLRAALIDRLEIDTTEDLKVAEDFLRHNDWNV